MKMDLLRIYHSMELIKSKIKDIIYKVAPNGRLVA